MIQKTLRLSAVALASLFAFGAAHAAGATLNLDGNLELDNTYQQTKTNPNPKDSLFSQSGRVELNFSGKATNGDAFVASKGTLLLGKSSSDDLELDGDLSNGAEANLSSNRAGVDDMWVQFGTGMGDIKLGRFEDVDMWPVGRDTVLNRAGGGSYIGQFYRGRIGSNVFHGVGTLNIAPGMTFSLGVIDQKGLPTRGIRPIFQFSTGGINLKAGLELGKVQAGFDAAGQPVSADFTGIGLTGGMGLAGGSLNVNLANGNVKNTAKHTTIGANFTMDLGPWALLEYGQIKPDAGGPSQKITTLGLGYQLSLLGVKGAFVTPALSTSQSKQGAAKTTDTSVRVRFNYGFNAF